MSKNYRVSFFKVEHDQGEKGKQVNKAETYVGSVVIDDSGTGPSLSIIGKAYRQVNDVLLMCDKVVVEQLC